MNFGRLLHSMEGYAWRELSGRGSFGDWKVNTRVQFGTRSDTDKPNNSPLSASLPLYRYISCHFTVAYHYHSIVFWYSYLV